uniref:Uncharacterized protein n=1 Tax=Panagrolaimus sp. ES5 TaxID=591445 RepID=A0AC34GCW6_9BILA
TVTIITHSTLMDSRAVLSEEILMAVHLEHSEVSMSMNKYSFFLAGSLSTAGDKNADEMKSLRVRTKDNPFTTMREVEIEARAAYERRREKELIQKAEKFGPKGEAAERAQKDALASLNEPDE